MKYQLLVFLLLQTLSLIAQESNFEAYIFEANNRGYLNQVKVNIYDISNNTILAELVSNATGQVEGILPVGKTVRVHCRKDIFHERNDTVTITSEKAFLKVELQRKPGYLFDVTLAESREDADQQVDAIEGARLEIYNYTKQKLELITESLPGPYFQFTFEQGNHYILLIRKEGYLAKRIDAHVNIDGCIICIEGVNNLRPGVTDVLTSHMSMGTLLANIDLQKAKTEAKIQISNINWGYNSAEITPQNAAELDKTIKVLQANPMYGFELGSHTDTRGNEQYNFELSHKRAQAAVDYMIDKGIDPTRLKAVGYGESQIRNRCAEGVKCTEEEHAYNRRTELKITGIFTDAKEFEPLVEIIRKEKIDKAREQLLRTETIEFKMPEVPTKSDSTLSDSTLVKATLDSLHQVPVQVKAVNTPKNTPQAPTAPKQKKATVSNLPISTTPKKKKN